VWIHLLAGRMRPFTRQNTRGEIVFAWQIKNNVLGGSQRLVFETRDFSRKYNAKG
jgi:hypothetical protein